MVKKLKKKENNQKSSVFYQKPQVIYLFLLGVLLFYLCGLFIKYEFLKDHPKSAFETPKTEMKTLPPDVKKQLETASAAANFRVPILMYHYIEYVQDKKDTIRQSLNINPDVFEAQVKTLQDAGYTFMTAKDLGEVLDNKISLPEKPILLTFDDGHWDFDTNVLPILKKYNVHATAYIITNFIGGSDFMSASQLQEVVDSGLVDVGAHTEHHIALKGVLLSRDQEEIDGSKKWLEDNYHLTVVSFAYPNGSFDAQAAQVVKDAEFTTAVSTIPGIAQSANNRFFLYRLRPGYRTGQQLLNWLNQNTFSAFR